MDHLLLALSLLLPHLVVAPQDGGAKQTPQDAARAFVEELAGEDGVLSLAEVQEGLAAIELLVVVDRELHAADYRLEKLRQRVEAQLRSDPTCVDHREASALTMAAHVELQLARGYLQDAWNEFEEPAALEGEGPHDPGLEAVHAVWNHPRIADLRAMVKRRLEGGNEGNLEEAPIVGLRFQGDKVDEAVREALSHHDSGFIEVLGRGAAPALARALGEGELDELPPPHGDAFYMLTSVDHGAAAEVALRHVEEEGLFWKKRVLRAMSEFEVLTSWSQWTRSSTFPPPYRYPAFLELLESWIDDPEVGDEVLSMLHRVVEYGALTPKLQAALSRALVDEDPERRAVAYNLAHVKWAHENLRPALEAVLEAPYPEVRIMAAWRLTQLEWSDALAAQVDHPDLEVRKAVAGLLTSRNVSSWGGGGWNSRGRKFKPVYGPRERALIVELLQDPDPEVRYTALRAYRTWPRHKVPGRDDDGQEELRDRYVDPPLSVLLDLRHDPDPEVRRELIEHVGFLPPEVVARILLTMVQDGDPGVVASAESALRELAFEDRPEESFEVLRARAANEAIPFEPIWSLGPRLKRDDTCRELFARWTASSGHDGLLVRFLGNKAERQRTVDTLQPTTFANILRAYDRAGETFASGLHRYLQEDVPETSMDEMLVLAADDNASPRLRAMAALSTVSRGGDVWQQRLHRALRDPWWAKVDEKELKYVRDRLRRAAPAEVNALVQTVVSDRTVSDRAAAWVAREYEVNAAGGVEAGRAVLARWFPGATDGDHGSAVHDCLRDMARSAALRDDALLARALEVPYYEDTAIGTIGRLRDPELLPLLARIVRERHNTESWETAVVALPGFLSDEAAELLLEAAAWTDDPKLRSFCMEQLEKIREFHLARDYWQRTKALEQARDSAISELFELLGSEREPVRVQAIRGLGTFEVIEAIPTLIRLMNDDSAAIRSEAEKALDRIHAASKGSEGD